MPATDIPASIQAMLLARVDRCRRRYAGWRRRLPSSDRASTQRCSGPSSPIPPGSTRTSRLLCDAEIIEEVAGSARSRRRAYRFTQTMLQDVIYQNLLLQRRTEMHGRIGAALRAHLRQQTRNGSRT